METFKTLLALVAACVPLAALAQQLKIPMAVALVMGGIVLAFLPGVPTITLDPELALSLFLPPLLQASAYRTDWVDFRSNLTSIMMLAVGAVFFTAAAVAIVARVLVPELPFWAALALGAIVAPPDAVAAAAVLKEVKLPKRIVSVLEGESLINDASSLVLYRFAVTATLAGTFSLSQGLEQFIISAVGGATVGWLVGRAAMRIFALLEDTLLDITVSLLAGFIAYLAAEEFLVSGVLASVVCGFVLGRQQHAEFTARTRLESAVVWGFVEFILTALVFVMIGLQLRGILGRLESYTLNQLAFTGTTIAATLVSSRFVWIFSSAWISQRTSRRFREHDAAPNWSHTFIMSWAGMRGVVSLAAALALPAQFPSRDLIIFLAFCAIVVTLVIQGTTLGWVIRRSGCEEQTQSLEPESALARVELAEAALEAVKEEVKSDATIEHKEAVNEVVSEYEARVEQATIDGDEPEVRSEQLAEQQRLRLIAIEAAREKLKEQVDVVDANTHRVLAEELDVEEEQIRKKQGET